MLDKMTVVGENYENHEKHLSKTTMHSFHVEETKVYENVPAIV